ncbi:5-(carboxyamino)imidazole ribonucleotide synthase [Periweissella fabalis]|uniref:N5-carboxyaminoimidazole ribonucleotide synthase n=1 Tax=Periweissella fabalis TaxID=1070421 RepID=A0A7X6S323_9LACO|nr:5-(carboxyamino)imidazole ribonucleotide synthase [Periweissella fabalis]MCM0598182.1 5-(carboxyamino)imidazole ribonucleotide synthase [Periweissella fabalis]NKZ24694.1 5-(carboxyamino)imidazole ribonucleotide synthase [Periweissella fabalis]
MIKTILPPQTIGIIGGGQLGQMLAVSAKSMGYHVGILDPTPNSPAGQVSDFQIIAAYNDQAALTDFAKRVDVLTYEFENIDLDALNSVTQITELPQGTELLRLTRNRLIEKNNLQSLGIPTVNFIEISVKTLLEKQSAIEKCLPGILKTTTGGYDGHGQCDVNTIADIKAAAELYRDAPAILEQRISFEKEISVMVTIDGNENVRIWPVVENKHANHILQTTIAPADVTIEVTNQVNQIAHTLAQAFNLRGVLGIEMFVTTTNEVLVNELAPRPHNSGHYSIEAMNVSQFEGHIRSITGLPIDKLTMIAPALMHNLLGEQLVTARKQLNSHAEWHFHDYGKAEIRLGRKLGHYTVLGEKNINKNLTWLIDNEE